MKKMDRLSGGEIRAMADAAQPKKNMSPDEVNSLAQKLHDGGIINLDTPMRQIIEHAKGTKPPVDDAWYVAGGGGYIIVCKS